MMALKVRLVYKGAIKNKDFLKQIFDADEDKKPSIFDSDQIKASFALIYYGWLVSKYGTDWKNYI